MSDVTAKHINVFHQGLIAPLDKHNVDTDQIIPKQFLSSVSRDGFGEALFNDWRYLDDGSENPEFILNQTPYREASVLLSRDNFGCGSSREHAPWALQQFGFSVVIAPSFADIFFANSINNQMLPLTLDAEKVDQLFDICAQQREVNVMIDLQSQIIHVEDQQIAFSIESSIKGRLLSGLDFIGVSEAFTRAIDAFEQQQSQQAPWL